MYMKNKFETFCKKIKEKYPNEDLKVLFYISSLKPAEIQCLKCRKIYRLEQGYNFLEKNKEKICSRCFPRRDTRKVGHKIQYLFEHNDNIELLSSYTKITDDLEILCKKCNSVFKRKPQKFLQSQKCPKCETFSQFKTKQVFEQELQTKLNGEYTLLGDYLGTNTNTLFRHNDCGFIFKNSPHTILQKAPCPKCKKFNSKGEIAIKKFLDKYNILYEQQFRDKEELGLLSFDFFLPEKSILIEFQGEQHFHPIKHFGGVQKFEKQKENDEIKRKYCKNHDIQLLEISYTNINNIENILSFLWLND